ncbi:MAG: hypothetical protein KC620_27420, partial [Myxococcales bacterium]|nr:hypothetical protein [Myxococcales bacterium]
GATICRETGTPKVELCDGQDNDCDGEADEDFAAVLGTACNAGGDSCLNDEVICDPEDSTQTTCGQLIAPLSEACNGADDDCDGQVDEDFKGDGGHLGEACDGDDSDLCVEGVYICNQGQNGTVCNDLTDGTVEACNGLDDDCDGATDEDWTIANTEYAGPYLGDACDGTNDADLCADGVI